MMTNDNPLRKIDNTSLHVNEIVCGGLYSYDLLALRCYGQEFAFNTVKKSYLNGVRPAEAPKS